ncbi:MAG: FkbM family methyltransferase [bacterium]|nr:FkbM family methyltransferase [bacterium]
MGKFRRINSFIYIFLKYKNWKNIIQDIEKEKDCNEIIFRDGIRISTPKNTFYFRGIIEKIFFNNIYTPSGFSIGNNDIIVDIGAHIGVFTLFAARKTKNMVYAFEPFNENFEFLNNNIHTNKLHNVVTYNKAITDKTGTEKLFLSESSEGHFIFNNYENKKLYKNVSSISLQYIIDNIIDKRFKQIDFLKLDCEGAEGLILSSTPEDYLLRIKKIVMEFHDTRSSLKHDEILDLLKKIGFVVRLDWDGKSSIGYIYAKRECGMVTSSN